MREFQTEKQLVLDLHRDLEAAGPDGSAAVLAQYLTPTCLWRGYHPFHEQIGPDAIGDTFWTPLMRAIPAMQRRQDIFFAGQNRLEPDPSVWVVSMGHLMGNLDAPWLGIPATGKLVMLRYCEFSRIDQGKITEQAMFFDIPHLMMQTGLHPFGPQTGQHLVQPGPRTHDGLLFADADPHVTDATDAAIDFMVNDISKWSGGKSEPLEVELARSWNDDMLWWGPAGIGASYTIERYAKQHSGPFRDAFQTREFRGHIARVCEGHYGGFFGWPNLTLEHKGGFMGMPATGTKGDMRVIDIYRRDGEKLSENWIFIDILHFWNMQGVDILGRTIANLGKPG
ncbi:MAG: ester cyclase [Paracoccaceae bacterium]